MSWWCYAHAMLSAKWGKITPGVLQCGYNPSRIQSRCPELDTEVTFYRKPASLVYSTRIRCSGCYISPSSTSWARLGPTTRIHIVGEPCGSRIDKSPSISWLNSKTSFIPGSFDVKSWSGLVLMKSFPRASCYLEQKVGGSWTLVVEKTENLFSGYVLCSPRASFRVLFDC
jgi:hypothetical protein